MRQWSSSGDYRLWGALVVLGVLLSIGACVASVSWWSSGGTAASISQERRPRASLADTPTPGARPPGRPGVVWSYRLGLRDAPQWAGRASGAAD